MTRMRAHCFSTASCFLIAVLCLCINMELTNGRDSIKTHLDDQEEEASTNYGINSKGTKWAVLVAGSSDYSNYRHQADVCHAYQLLKKGDLKDENIVVFMYDDIAYNEDNPRPGVIINKPKGKDVYNGVPKDYTREEVTVENLFAVLLGNKSAVKGGSGKVVDSGPNDHIFVYYTDHGGPGVLEMPSGDNLYANELIEVLKEKHSSGTYKKMVIYVEACESGSIFEGLLPKDMNIYVTTASKSDEDSFATYCPGDGAPEEYDTCLGDLYSVAWLEDSDKQNRQAETLKKQYHRIKNRTAPIDHSGSHVMRYGDLKMDKEKLAMFMGSNTDDDDDVITDEMSSSSSSFSRVVNQRDADVVYFWEKFIRAPEGSTKKLEAQKQLAEIIQHRVHIDKSIKQIGELLFNDQNAILNTVRPSGQPLVDDWDCLRSMVRTFETHCGSLSTYGLKHMRAIANICNNAAASAATDDIIGVDLEKNMTQVAKSVCPSFPTNPWSSLKKRSVN